MADRTLSLLLAAAQRVSATSPLASRAGIFIARWQTRRTIACAASKGVAARRVQTNKLIFARAHKQNAGMAMPDRTATWRAATRNKLSPSKFTAISNGDTRRAPGAAVARGRIKHRARGTHASRCLRISDSRRASPQALASRLLLHLALRAALPPRAPAALPYHRRHVSLQQHNSIGSRTTRFRCTGLTALHSCTAAIAA